MMRKRKMKALVKISYILNKNLSISNIAWTEKEEKNVVELLKKEDITKIEIALTKINGTWKITKDDLLNFKNKFKNFEIYSIQSLNYGTSYNLFLENSEFLKHIYFVIDCASILGSKILVFGSPKNRYITSNEKNINDNIFIDTMIKIGEKCKQSDIVFCIEPNSKLYSCNYITNSSEAFDILSKINHPNVKLHLDSACMHMESDFNIKNSDVNSLLNHYHISEPYLSNFFNPECNHNYYSKSLFDTNYQKVKSIEMKYDENNCLNNISNAIFFAKRAYF